MESGRVNSVGSDAVEHVVFAAPGGPDTVTFVVLGSSGYDIRRNGVSTGTWPADELDACIGAYMRIIDRRPRPALLPPSRDDWDPLPGRSMPRTR
jgi:hypothetical protein